MANSRGIYSERSVAGMILTIAALFVHALPKTKPTSYKKKISINDVFLLPLFRFAIASDSPRF